MSAVPQVRRTPRTAVSADGRVTGYASLFGRPDMAGDRMERGAFARTIRERGADGIRMLWQHDPKEPIGVWTRLAEDETGLIVEGRLALSSRKGREVHELIRAGAVDGLSIGFRTRKALRTTGSAGRRVLDVDLWEISIVTFPMQSFARLSPVEALAQRAERGARALADGMAQRLSRAARSLREESLGAAT